jgi:FdhD protein
VIAETPVSLTVNGQVWLTWMCTPTDLEALAVGFLFNEGVIETWDEVASVRLCDTEDNVDIWLTHSVDKPEHWRRTSGCTGGVTQLAEKWKLAGIPRLSATSGRRLTVSEINNLLAKLFESQEIYRKSGGVHTSALSDGEQIIMAADDIGRHNTLDKIAGRCLMEGVALPEGVLITTGRISSEMMQKAARIGVSTVISRTSPSALSVEMAVEWGVTLIGYARRNQFRIYAHAERVMTDSEHRDSIEEVYDQQENSLPTH